MKEDERRLIEKFIHDSLTENELKTLKEWLSDEQNLKFLEKEVQLDHLIKSQLLRFNTEDAYTSIKLHINHEEKRKNKMKILRVSLKYAAIFAGVLVLGYGIFNRAEVSEKLVIRDEQVTLKLEDGNTIIINPSNEEQITDQDGNLIASQDGETLKYPSKQSRKKITYNTLQVPFGKTFTLLLSDQTRVYLNSGSELTYPKEFQSNERKVFLKGEAFFEVTKNKNAPFIVSTANKNITVLGTKFNVSAYEDISESTAVLLEGAIALNDLAALHDPILLHPNEMAAWDKNGNPDIKTVNPYDYMAWMEGKLVFNKKPFEEILARLEKKYNVTIDNRYLELNEQRYQGSFDDIPVYEVLDTFKETRFFNYEIKNNTIIITKPAQ
ncbi:FecR domain-containing protein [Zhouia spongiae]|uniref:FecR domain-containing protein n=1 Tax=Zhouia spongiae TaxID=2202721 RepID=A0ABY3YN54_9FLAO|nr:FecR domain-containing protein [Zhouia spongiae]UNY99017.1 FecR domain-containing protein [Zhouia spongiae]